LTIVLTIPIFKFAPKTVLWNRLVLKSEQKNSEGYRSSPVEYDTLIGKKGVSVSALRPAGIAVFDDRRLDVVAMGDFIESNQPIEIIKVEGYRIIVNKIS